MKKLSALLAIAIALTACQSKKNEATPKTIGNFTFSSKDIVANTPFTITYTGTGNLGDGFCHNIIDLKHFPYDVEFTNNQTVITVPDSISNVAFYFKVDDAPDNNNGIGYLFNVVDKNGTIKPNTEASKQYYLMYEGTFNDLKGGDARPYRQVVQRASTSTTKS